MIIKLTGHLGSIPVHTGKPWADVGKKVYPRTHGETATPTVLANSRRGLSPYTRGNRRLPLFTAVPGRSIPVHTGSIPVHTGKPFISGPTPLAFKVYPRTHGETRAIPFERPNHPSTGLSPYTRGNLDNTNNDLIVRGSIPVHTGKPFESIKAFCINKVYPRTHGETGPTAGLFSCTQGLSPYTRGNHSFTTWRKALLGSIPVHTGKPNSLRLWAVSPWVYPRTHGETLRKVPIWS